MLQAQGLCGDVDKGMGNILYGLASKLKSQVAFRQGLLVKYIAARQIASMDQLDGR